jgi:predicted DNA-binding transcriptional regulator AlpA
MTDRKGLAFPPIGLCREDAALYIGVGPTKWDEMVADGRMPKPIHIDRRVVWDRLKIEAAFRDLGQEAPQENYLDGPLKVARR